MERPSERGKTNGHRKSLLELAPLELDCMNTLWPLSEASVREIRDGLAPRRPRAYTTIMTIMDRLAHKGVVTRRKVGKAYRYQPSLTAEEARAHAIAQLLEGFFGGSTEALVNHLALGGLARHTELRRAIQRPAEPRARKPRPVEPAPAAEPGKTPRRPAIDETLL